MAQPQSKQRRPVRGQGWVAKIVAAGLIAGISLLALGYIFYSSRANLIDISVVKNIPQSSILYDMHGVGFSRVFSENRIMMPEDKPVPKLLEEAVIDTEDRRFYQHGGIDPYGLSRALVSNVMGRGARQGGSTITQQLARNSIGMMQRTYDRKFLEFFLANRIEHSYSKAEILRYYLDRIYFGQGLYGAETAATAFFGCSVEQLNLGQAAMLAGIISSPNSSSPWKDIRAAKAARARALERMVKAGHITAVQADHANRSPLALRPRPSFAGGFASNEVRRELESVLEPEVMQQGGLKVFTTIDWNLQQVAEKAVAARVNEIEASKQERHPRGLIDPQTGEPYDDILEASFIAIDPSYGAIRALVGSRDFQISTYDRATQARRQVGSTIKPLLYAVAMAEKGYYPGSSIESTPFDLRVGNPQARQGEPAFLRINDALVKSDNYAAMRMGMIIGPDLLNRYARQCGVTTDLPPYASTYLGACDISLSELTGIYATMANQGVAVKQHIVVQVRDVKDQIIYQNQVVSHQVFTPQVARQITGMMENVIDFGTGSPVRQEYHLTVPAAGKTGTTNDYKDCWFEGFTSHLVAGAWVGYDRPREIMPGGYAARVALPIWARVMSAAQGQYVMEPFPVPEGLQVVNVGGDWLNQGGEKYYVTAEQRVQLDQTAQTSDRQDNLPHRSLIDHILDIFR